MRLHAFGLLAGIALLKGGRVFLYRARRQGPDAGPALVFLFGVAAAGSGCALLYYWLVFGRVRRALLFRRDRGWNGRRLSVDGHVPAMERWRHLDNLAFAFAMGWIFGRAGWALAHNHLGPPSTSFLAVRFAGGPRLDFGLLEMLFSLFLAAVFLALDRWWTRSRVRIPRSSWPPTALFACGGVCYNLRRSTRVLPSYASPSPQQPCWRRGNPVALPLNPVTARHRYRSAPSRWSPAVDCVERPPVFGQLPWLWQHGRRARHTPDPILR